MKIESPGDAYAHARSAAARVVDRGRTGSGDATWTSGREQVGCADWSGCELALLHATLHGCVQALTRSGVTAADVGDSSYVPPAGVEVSCFDVARAEGWLAASLADELGDDQRRALVDVYVVAEDRAHDVQRIASMVDATVLVALAASSRAHARPFDRRRPRPGRLHLVSAGIPA